MIKAPFNFVPLNDKVFYPKWAELVSQDVPFEDGEDGVIEIKVEAQTPIFVRNGHTQNDAKQKNEKYKSFSIDPNGKYFIPATSIKGEIRNVLSILSCGKMSQMNNNRYSMRDLKSDDYLSSFKHDMIHCGWMRKDGDNIIISDCGIPYRISMQKIDYLLGTQFCLFVEKSKFTDKEKTAKYKYQMVEGKNLRYTFELLPSDSKNPADKRMKVKPSSNGGIEGDIVFTGQPGTRKEVIKNGKKSYTGKFFEFVFPTREIAIYKLNPNEESGLYQDFDFIYQDSEDWMYWKNKMKQGEPVPIFMCVQNGNLSHFGLSYLYKLPSKKHLKDYLPSNHTCDDYDLADCLMGCVKENKAIKGRVMIGHAYLEEGGLLDCRNPYMGSPKPSYYPIYLQQDGGANGYLQNSTFYKTLLDDDAKLKGWKRYPIRFGTTSFGDVDENQIGNTCPFIPIDANSKFSYRIVIHNLRMQEIGALLAAIELRGSGYHSLGFAKAYGYGVVKMSVEKVTGLKEDKETYIKAFVDMMRSEIENYNSIVSEFYKMSVPQSLKTMYPLEYMTFDKSHNEFAEAKGSKNNEAEYLPWYSEMVEKKDSQPRKKELEYEAKVTVWGALKMVSLKGHKVTNSLKLDILATERVKCKIGDMVLVNVQEKNGKIQSVRFLKKL